MTHYFASFMVSYFDDVQPSVALRMTQRRVHPESSKQLITSFSHHYDNLFFYQFFTTSKLFTTKQDVRRCRHWRSWHIKSGLKRRQICKYRPRTHILSHKPAAAPSFSGATISGCLRSCGRAAEWGHMKSNQHVASNLCKQEAIKSAPALLRKDSTRC